MITGGTGSFGNAVLERFLKTGIGEIRIFSRDEKKQDDMRHAFQAAMPEAADKLRFFIGDVRDLSSIRNAMYGVDYIFHAAALKQVPSCEFFPLEAVKTNVIGTDNVLTAAIDAEVKSIICLSTDKAAYPVNAMGTSKAMMEKVIVAKSRTVSPERTKICCTRYGNVLCSRGSVVPLWIDQIKAGKPLTITEPEMTRFVMSLEEAVCFPLKMNVDERGSFTELLKTANCGQFSVNISKPGITKGQHWHHSKWEFFMVVSGQALIQEREIGSDKVLEFRVSGENIQAVHMLPGYTHNIINLSDTEDLVTVMWANERFDPQRPDTYFEEV